MAYNFNGSNQYLSTASSPASGTPMTIACWMRPTNSDSLGAGVSVGQTSASHRNQVFVQASRIDIAAQGASALSQVQSSDATAFSNVWTHGAGVFASATSRTVYKNGGNSATVTTNIGSQNAFASALVGVRDNGSIGLYFNGNIADVGIWNAALTADEIASLADGMTCDKVRPQSLVFYAPLVRDLIDAKGGLTITNNNTATVAIHPRVYS
jgi:hypothetical protein